jgi:N-acetylneuraminic acid mutarotase
MSGSSGQNALGTYGTVGAPGGVPGAREYASSATAPSGVFVFGGTGYASTSTAGDLNDLWKWDGTTWTWLSGSTTVGQASVYGTLGVASPSNVPGARSWATTWADKQGNLWLFGGYDGATKGHLNDLWRWDNATWTWVGGANVADQRGVYGTLGSPSPGSIPGARWGATSWLDANGTVWLFGGAGYDAAGALGNLNDLWRFDGKAWTWMGGSSTADPPGDYGTSGVPAATNVPGGRAFGVSWPQRDGTFWLFGGLGPGLLNDLWRYRP